MPPRPRRICLVAFNAYPAVNPARGGQVGGTETRAWLANHRQRFEYIHTPKRGSSLNWVESAFSMMAHAFLRHICVASVDEHKQCTLKGIDEMNSRPARFQWKNFDFPLTRT